MKPVASAAELKVTEELWHTTKTVPWEWPEKARARLSLYVAAGKYDDAAREACVRCIQGMVRGS